MDEAQDAKVKVDLRELIRTEYSRCSVDPKYFLSKYAYIQTVEHGRMLFALHDFQKDVLDVFDEKQYTMILKARQIGITTLVAGYALHQMLFHRDQNIAVVATKIETAKNIITKIKFAFENLPKWLSKGMIVENNKLSIRFKNGSQIKAASSTASATRGESLTLLILDEAAYLPNAEETWVAAQATLGKVGKAIALSCVTKDTYVHTPMGPQTLGQIIDSSKIGPYEKPYSVLGRDKCRDGTWLINNDVQPTRKIVTKHAELEGSLAHKLWAYRNGKYDWYTMGELEEGDWISVHYGANLWGNNDDCSDFVPSTSPNIRNPFNPTVITADLAYLLGLYIAEGFCYKAISKHSGMLMGGNVTISCGDDVSEVIRNIGLPLSKYKINHSISSKNFIEFLEYLGFDVARLAPRKIIPERLFCMSKENIKALLQGIFDGDGCAHKTGATSLCSTSRELIHQVRMLLNNFGILSSVYEYPVEKMKVTDHHIINRHSRYVLEMYGVQGQLFFTEIGFRFSRKQCRELDVYAHRTRTHNLIPGSAALVREIVSLSKISFYKFQQMGIQVHNICNSRTPYHTEHICVETVHKLYTQFGYLLSPETRNYWDRVLMPNVSWEPIKKSIESENAVFDFSLPNNESDFWCHSVIYNGILGHQSPNGIGNWFHKTYTQAEEFKGRDKDEVFYPVKLDWRVLPSYNQEWRDQQDARLGPQKARQEYDAAFIGSGNTVIDADIIEFYNATYVQEPVFKMNPGGDLWIWEDVNYTNTYILSADVARGEDSRDGDYSAFHVFNAKTCEQVAEYRGRIPTTDYGNLLVATATKYNDALLIIERESIGWAVIQQVINRGYRNLFYMTQDLKFVDPQTQLHNRYYAEERKALPGFGTTSRTRPLLISKLDQYMRDKSVIFHSSRLINELHSFIWHNGKAQAADGSVDDLVMAFCIGLWVRDTALELHAKGVEYSRMILDKMEQTHPFDSIYTPNNQVDPYKFQLPMGGDFDLRGLL